DGEQLPAAPNQEWMICFIYSAPQLTHCKSCAVVPRNPRGITHARAVEAAPYDGERIVDTLHVRMLGMIVRQRSHRALRLTAGIQARIPNRRRLAANAEPDGVVSAVRGGRQRRAMMRTR